MSELIARAPGARVSVAHGIQSGYELESYQRIVALSEATMGFAPGFDAADNFNRGNLLAAGIYAAIDVTPAGWIGDIFKAGVKLSRIGKGASKLAQITKLNQLPNIAKFTKLNASAPKAAVDSLLAGTRLDGQLYGHKAIEKLGGYLERRGVTLHVGGEYADELLDLKGANGLFRAKADGTGELFLRADPTWYEVLHELQHFIDHRNLGFEGYKNLGKIGREQSVYDALRANRAWDNIFNQAERDHAWWYIFMKGGNPLE